ncbi:hypothetical protein FIBSPDRAFT_847864 [Athelia psychrophila]|uniref:Uncharacterized protein n=1 Tax=Athelia psychrophila TaxID=1759441 RepID=A0A166W0C8_9AGAM|nr:hypothetical protein FIBSPDRAFT_847864 [Fibularhizoctonia sp. CBS 109695]
MSFDPLPEHLMPVPGTRILPPVLHYGYAVPLDRIMSLDVLRPTPKRASPSTFLIARTVRQASEWLQENVFKARVVTATVMDDQAKFVFSLYTNYTAEERNGRADVCAVEEKVRDWLSTEGVDMEAKWYVDGDDWYWRWATASR